MPYIHETTPEKEAEIARQALAAGDLGHALYHVGTALGPDPTNRQYLALLEDLLGRTSEALTLVRMDDNKADFITAATRAYILAREDRVPEALALMCNVAAVRPDTRFLVWAVDWVRRPGVAGSLPAELVEGELLPPLLKFVINVPVPVDPEDPRKASVDAAGEICAVLRQAHPQLDMLLFGSSVIERRRGNFGPAMHFASQAYELKKDWNTAIGVACACRDGGQTDNAVAWYRHALTFDPDDIDTRLDIGDTLLGDGRFEEAIAAYQEVLERQEHHPWAEASVVFARFKQTGEQQHKDQLFRLADHSGKAWSLFCEIQPPQTYVHTLPGPGDATAHALRDVLRHISQNREKAQGGNVNLKVTHPESPSVLTAFNLWKKANAVDVGLGIEVEQIQTPDPRAPKAQVDFTLWAYDDSLPRPNMGVPDERAQEAVAAIARETYNLEIWDPLARQTAARFGVAWLPHFLCTMVHPPDLPQPEMDPLGWVQRAQIAVALIIGRMETGWANSQRRKTLLSLIYGPVDWAVDAALIVLGWLAREDQSIRADAQQVFAWLQTQIPEGDAFTCFEYPLVSSWLAMGGLDEATEKKLSEWKQQIEQKGRVQSQEQQQQQEVHGGLTLEQYAELSVKRDEILEKHGGGVGGALAAMAGQGAYPELEALCKEYGVDPRLVGGARSGAAARIPDWDTRINEDPMVQEMYLAMMNDARLKLHGIEFSSHEGRVAEMIRAGAFDVEGARVAAEQASREMAEGKGDDDPDPVVFPGQPIERLSQYVELMKGMQTGDMAGALARFGLDMGTYGQVAQAWGIKLASDAMLTAKFSRMMGA